PHTDRDARHPPARDRFKPVTMAWHDQPGRKRVNVPPRKGIETEIEPRLNNALLARPVVKEGWLLFRAQAKQLAVGAKLVGLGLGQPRPLSRNQLLLQIYELDVKYHC